MFRNYDRLWLWVESRPKIALTSSTSSMCWHCPLYFVPKDRLQGWDVQMAFSLFDCLVNVFWRHYLSGRTINILSRYWFASLYCLAGLGRKTHKIALTCASLLAWILVAQFASFRQTVPAKNRDWCTRARQILTSPIIFQLVASTFAP